MSRESVAVAWEQAGGTVLRLGRFWDPPALDRQRVRVYGGDSFCLVLQQRLDLSLVSPPDDLLVSMPPELLGREVFVLSLEDSPKIQFPAFVRPLTPKLFRASVYDSLAALERETTGIESAALLMVSQVVSFTAEARAFVLDGAVLDCAVYEGHAAAEAARQFTGQVAATMKLPRAVVVDVGLTPTG